MSANNNNPTFGTSNYVIGNPSSGQYVQPNGYYSISLPPTPASYVYIPPAVYMPSSRPALVGSNNNTPGDSRSLLCTDPHGTTFKFDPLMSGDTTFKNGIQWRIQTKHQFITAMKTYETKSVEELRFEDYVANRKGRGSVFRSNTLFGQQNRPLVGGSTISPKKIATVPKKKISKDQCSQTEPSASGLESELKQLQLQEGINDLKNQLTKSLKAKDEEIEEVKEQLAKVQQQLVEIQSVMGAPANVVVNVNQYDSCGFFG